MDYVLSLKKIKDILPIEQINKRLFREWSLLVHLSARSYRMKMHSIDGLSDARFYFGLHI